jgi:hypothetical protein
MSEYGRLKVTAIRVGITMVFLALLAGIGEKIASRPAKATVTPAAEVTQPSAGVAQVLKGKVALKLKGLSPELKADFRVIGDDVSRLLEEQGVYYFFKHTDGGHTLLTKSDASKKYLSIGGTAQNSNEVGGLRPSAFVQGDGGLVSGAATLSGGAKSQKLLSTPGIEVDVAINGDGFPSVSINNSTGLVISAILDQGGTDASITLQPGSTSLTLSLQNGIDQLHLQTYPAGSFNRIVTLIVNINFNSAHGSSAFAGQLIDGGI